MWRRGGDAAGHYWISLDSSGCHTSSPCEALRYDLAHTLSARIFDVC